MPERADECVVEENMLSLMSISIGDTITLTPGDDLSDALAQDTYTVVGTVRSPVYLAVERGTSTLGSGTVKAYLYLPREAFTLDYYTAAYVRVSGAAEMTAFYSDYDDYIDAVIDELEPFGDARRSCGTTILSTRRRKSSMMHRKSWTTRRPRPTKSSATRRKN